MRLNRFISSTGFCSRRQADELIKQGKVKVNNNVAVLGTDVNPDDVIEVNGTFLKVRNDHVYIALNKPRGIVCTTERHIEGNIIDFVNYPERIFPIGRLDKDSEGLILLTNDGGIVNEVLRSANNHEKEYVVTVDKDVTKEFLLNMSNGVKIYNPVRNEYTVTNPCKVVKENNRTFRIILIQGLNRQIRRMCARLGYNVIKLKRIRIMNIELGNLPVGKWRHLTDLEIENLLNILKQEEPVQKY